MAATSLDRNAHLLKNALPLAYLSAAAYHRDAAGKFAPTESRWFSKTQFANVVTFQDPKKEVFGFATGDTDHVVLAFQGTQEVADWYTNLDLKLVAEPGGKVHAGFQAYLDRVWSKALAALTRMCNNGQTIWVTGHSLGGALATLATHRLAGALKPFATYTFGQPRTGDSKYAQAYDRAHRVHHRFVNNDDIVPTIPPPAPVHVTAPHLLHARRQLAVCRRQWGVG